MSYSIETGASWVLRETRLTYDIIRGAQVINVYEGTPAGLNSVIRGLRGWERYELDSSDSPRCRLTVYTPDPAEAPVWEVLSNLKQVRARELPQFSSVSSANLDQIQQYFENPGLSPNFTGPDASLANQLWLLEKSNKDIAFSEDVVLRYSFTVTNARQIALQYANYDAIFSHSALLTPAKSALVIPAGIRVSLNAAALPAPTSSDANMLWGWLKRKPTSRQTQIGKVLISGEWWLGWWNVLLYPNPIA